LSIQHVCLADQSTSRLNDRILISDLPNYHLYVPACLSMLLSTYLRT